MLTITGRMQGRLSAALAAGEPFRNAGNTFHGSPGFSGSYGRLPFTLRQLLLADRAQYVIYSYGTPIAWRTADGTWTVPAVSYSPITMQQHQYTARHAARHA